MCEQGLTPVNDLFPAPYSEPTTSKQAAERIEGPTRESQLVLVRRAYVDAGKNGLTDQECQRVTGLDDNSQRPRKHDLFNLGEIVRTVHMRPTGKNGGRCRVIALTTLVPKDEVHKKEILV